MWELRGCTATVAAKESLVSVQPTSAGRIQAICLSIIGRRTTHDAMSVRMSAAATVIRPTFNP